MSTLFSSEGADQQDWDLLLRNCPDAHIKQSAEFARFYSAFFKGRPIFLRAVKDGEVVALMLAFVDSPFWASLSFTRFRRLFAVPARWLFPILVCQGGPIRLSARCDPDSLTDLCETLIRVAQDQKCIEMSQMKPNIYSDDAAFDMTCDTFRALGFSVQMHATYVVDLQRSEEDIWSAIARVAKKSIRRCQREGVVVTRAGSVDDVRLYHQLLFRFRTDKDLAEGDVKQYLALWRFLRQTDSVEFFLAWHGARLIGGMGVFNFNGVVEEFAVARDEAYCRESGLSPGDAIKWAIMCWGLEVGARKYDLAGVSPTPQSEKDANIRRFKEKWGGDYVEYPLFSMRLGGLRLALFEVMKSTYERYFK